MLSKEERGSGIGRIGISYYAEGIITACHLTFAGPKGQMSDQNLVWSDILANEIIGGASAASAATVRSSKSRFAIDICLVRANHTEHARKG